MLLFRRQYTADNTRCSIRESLLRHDVSRYSPLAPMVLGHGMAEKVMHQCRGYRSVTIPKAVGKIYALMSQRR